MDTPRAGRLGLGLGVLGLGAVAAWEAAALRRVATRADVGGRDHTTVVGEGVGERLELLLLGDSAVDGHGLNVAASLPRQLASRLSVTTGRRVRVRSVAVSGATTSDVAAFQVPLLRAAGGVDAVLVGVGVNDVLRRTRAPALREAMRQLLVGVAAAAPGAAVAVATCPDLSRAPGPGPLVRRALGVRCRAVARVQRRVLEEHGVAEVAAEEVPGPELFGEDGLHPGRAANEVVAALAVRALLGDRSVRAPGAAGG